ncbi:MAG: preprotein translocase subunit SecG [Oscillospiraceae bacterium]|jgi:preprotein translocase subunit SecG|nr:preprotein translocase subunit SecG [Oscillospiraceae bacterium]
MSVWEWVIGGLILVFALAVVVAVLLQEGRRSGISGAIAGGADTFLSKTKARTVDAALARWTRVIAIVFFLLVLAALVVSVLLKQ